MATKKARAKRKSPAAKKTATRKRVTKKSAPHKVARKKTAARKSARKRPVARKAPRRASRKAAAAKPAATTKRTAAAKPAPTRKKTASAKRTKSPRRASASPKLDASLFPVGDDALRGATGRSWQEWLGLLDKAGAGAGSLDHQQIHDLAMQWVPGADRWWGQMVSTGYERARAEFPDHAVCRVGFSPPHAIIRAKKRWAEAHTT